MKTQRECHEALCAGKTLINIYGALYKYSEEGVLVRRLSRSSDWEKFTYIFLEPENWEIYEEPKPKATYEDAINNLSKVIIELPIGTVPNFHIRIEEVVKLLLADLAERKGYRMEVIK